MASLLLELYQKMGLKTILLCEQRYSYYACFSISEQTEVVALSQDKYYRDRELKKCIERGVSVLIVNKSPELLDIDLFLNNRIPVYLYCHCGIEFDVLLDNAYDIYNKCSGVITVSKEDYYYGRILGLKTFYIPNVFDSRLKYAVPVKWSKTVLWIGRLFPEEKQPLDALEVMKKLVQLDPDINMYLLGTTGDKRYDNEFFFNIKKMNLESNVHYVGFCNNPYLYFSHAGLFLQTSQRETFSMTMLESRAYGIPSVAYSVPTSDLLKENGCGTVRIRPNDVDSAVINVYDILNNLIRWRNLQKAARRSFLIYSQKDFCKIWKEFFNID